MNRLVAPLALGLLLVLSGCFGGKDAPDPVVEEPAPPATATSITPLGEPVRVTLEGHRIAEFMVQRNPHDADHLVTAYGDYDSYGGVLNCGFAVSRDGGASWTVSEPIQGFAGPYLQFDGWVDFDEYGGVHATCLEQGGRGTLTPDNTNPSAWPYYFNSDDGGVTWKDVMHIPTNPPDRSTDKSVLGVGKDGTVYAAVSGIVGTTKDNGTTWVAMDEIMQMKEGRLVDAPFSVLDGFVEDNQGTVFLLGLGSGDEVWVMRSTDGGVSWTEAVAGQFYIPPGFNDQNRWVEQRPWTALPTMAHDPVSDEIWVTFQSWDPEYGGYRLHIYRSIDHGVTFMETAIPEFGDPACSDPCHVTHPSLAFDLQGRVGMTVQLTRDEGILKIVQFTVSADHGETWLPPVGLSATDGMQSWRNPNAFTPLPENGQAIATGVAENPAMAQNVAVGIGLTSAVSELQMRWNGEYWGTAATSKGFVAMWIDHSNDGRPHLYSQIVQVE